MDEDEDIMDEEEGPFDVQQILQTARASLEDSIRHVNTSLDMLRQCESGFTFHDRFRFLSREVRHMPVIQRLERLAYPDFRIGPDGNRLPETEEDRRNRNQNNYFTRSIDNFFQNNVHKDDILPQCKESGEDYDTYLHENDVPLTLQDLIGPRKTSLDLPSEVEDTVHKPKKNKSSFSKNISQDELSEAQDTIQNPKKCRGSFSRNASQDELSEVEDVIRKPKKRKGSFLRNISQDELSEIEDHSMKCGRLRARRDIGLFKGEELNDKDLKSGSEAAKGKDVERSFEVQSEAQKESSFAKNIEKSKKENNTQTKSNLDELLTKQHALKHKFDKKKQGKQSSTQDKSNKHKKLGNKKSALKQNEKDRKKSTKKNLNAESSFELLLECKKVDNGNLQSASVNEKVVIDEEVIQSDAVSHDQSDAVSHDVSDEEGIQSDAVSHDVSEEGVTLFVQDFINQGIERNVRLSIALKDIMKDPDAKNDPEVYKFLKKNKSAENVVEEKDTSESEQIIDNQKSDDLLNEIISSAVENISNHIVNIPIADENISNHIVNIPIEDENISNQIVNMPIDNENISNQIVNMPIDNENISNQIVNIPINNENITVDLEYIPTPSDIESISSDMVDLVTELEDFQCEVKILSDIENFPREVKILSDTEKISSDTENTPSQMKNDEVVNLENSPELFTDCKSPSVSEEPSSLVEGDLENFNIFDAKVDFESIEHEIPDQLKSKDLTSKVLIQDDEKEEYSEVEHDMSDDEDYVDIDEADSNVGDTEVDLLQVLLPGGDEELFDENLFEDC